MLYNGKQCLPRMINNICEFKDRCNFINQILKEQYDLGRKILILSDRRGRLDETKKWANKKIKENCRRIFMLEE